jgi:RHS repeat-associated protein
MIGQRTQLTANVPTQGFTNAISKYYYDSLYQLMKVNYPAAAPFSSEVDQWTYDAIGNRLTNTVNGTTANYTYLKNGANPLNGQRLSNDGVNAYTWDFNGSDLTRNGAPGNFTLGYSLDNRMTSISGAATATYVYDYQGRRTSKTVSGVTTTYLYDGLNLVTETTGGNPVRYLFGPGIDEPLATSQGVNVGYFSVDGLGTTGVISSPTGTAQNSYVFDAWGTARASSATLTNSFGYTSREFGEAGLLGYRARYLQPGLGRFTLEDEATRLYPIDSQYSYVRNAPVRRVDPTGLVAWTCTTVSASHSPAAMPVVAAGFLATCTSPCVNHRQVEGVYAILAGGRGESFSLPLEFGSWTVEDDQGTPDGKNLEGAFTYAGVSVVPGWGVSYSVTHMGLGHGTWGFSSASGIGIGIMDVAGRSFMRQQESKCCNLDGPVMHAP